MNLYREYLRNLKLDELHAEAQEVWGLSDNDIETVEVDELIEIMVGKDEEEFHNGTAR